MTWHRIGTPWDIEPGGRKIVEVAGRELAVLHTEDGLYCIDHRCPHAGAALGAGNFDRERIVCPQHKWRFLLEDGSHNKNPRVCPPAGVYQLRADGESLMVEIQSAPRSRSGPREQGPRQNGSSSSSSAKS